MAAPIVKVNKNLQSIEVAPELNKKSLLCFCLFCGIPASGKSSLAKYIVKDEKGSADHRTYFHLEYDRVITHTHTHVTSLVGELDMDMNMEKSHHQVQDQSQGIVDHQKQQSLDTECLKENSDKDFSIWKQQRSLLTFLIEEFLTHLVTKADCIFPKPSGITEGMWTAFLEMVPPELNSGWRSQNELILLIDDNLHLHSMRHEYFKMARKFHAGFCEIYMESDLSEALKRNKMRKVEQQVSDETIMKMASALEPPNKLKCPWEECILVINSGSQFQMEPINELIAEALAHPVQPLPECDTEEKTISRFECSVSTLHQVDLILRKCVKDFMASNKQRQHQGLELKELGRKASCAKDKIIQELKKNNQEILLEVSKLDIQDAAKDSESDLFKLIYELFHSELT